MYVHSRDQKPELGFYNFGSMYVCMYVCMYVWNKGIWKETINIGRYKILVIFPEIIQNKNFR
jgi:hypothetical protein